MKTTAKYIALNHSWLIVPRQYKVFGIPNQSYYMYVPEHRCFAISASDSENKL